MSLPRIQNPQNPWSTTSVEWIGPAPKQGFEVYTDHGKSILSKNDSPDLPFRWSLNPYRGCAHACAYCYARPSHQFLDFGAGTDFDRKLVIKPDAARLLADAFERPGWSGELVLFSGNTDCYQPLEATYGLTRACLEVCALYRNPVCIITKSPLIERDIPLLQKLHRETHLSVVMSIPFFDARQARAIEPTVPGPQRRIEALRRLAQAGLTVGVNVAPIIPGLNDDQIKDVLTAAAGAGAQFADMIMVRLPKEVEPVFIERLRAQLPERADRVLSRIKEMRGGALNDPRFGTRMVGEGPYAQAVQAMFKRVRENLNLGGVFGPPTASPFRRPPRSGDQLTLGV